VLRFPVADSRIRSVNRSPLGAASQSIADSLSFFYECARRKSRRNSRTAKRKSDALQKIILSMNFATTETCATQQETRVVLLRRRLAGVFASSVEAEKSPGGRRRHEKPARLSEARA
jgi:hypothetical protein